jgi:signal transduction histidine kinase
LNWGRPSLAKKLALSFFLSALLLGVVVGSLIGHVADTTHRGPVIAAKRLAKDLRGGVDGALTLADPSPTREMLGEAPEFWAVVKDARGERLVIGRPPASVLAFVAAAPMTLSHTSALNFSVPGSEPTNLAVFDVYETPVGLVAMSVGGVSSGSLGSASTVLYLRAITMISAAPAALVLALVLWLVVAPLVLKGIRPVAAAAAAIDGSEPSRRLPEDGVVSELLPIVRAFNGALGRLEEVLERRRRFMADAAHELRTPLAVLNMHVETLPSLPAKADLQRCVFRLSEMIGQMMDAERLRGPGRKREPLDLTAQVREAATEVVPLALAAGYDLTFFAEAEPVTILGDAHAVRRAVTNLLGNAVAHGGGSGRIEVRVNADASVEVCDQGPGVVEAERERVFEPFHRERWDRDGCGLGLHLVREIMRAHGGEAEILPSPRGARFRLSFTRDGG